MSANLFIGYNRNDFLYTKANVLNSGDKPSDKLSNTLPFPLNNENCNKNRNDLISIIYNNFDIYNNALADATKVENGPRTIQETFVGGGSPVPVDVTVTSKDGNGEVYASNAFVKQTSDGKLGVTIKFRDQKTIVTESGEKLTVSSVTSNPVCYFNDNCVKKHNHYKSCKQQIFKNEDGSTYCKCICSGGITFDDIPHSHCEERTLENFVEGFNTETVASNGDTITYSIDLPAQPPAGTSSAGYGDYSYSDVDKDVNKMNVSAYIADYYIAMCENKKKALEIEEILQKTSSGDQLFADANTAYSTQYQRMINISLCILAVGGSFYFVLKNPPK